MKLPTFDSLEHEVLYELLNIKKVKSFNDIISYETSFTEILEEIYKYSINTSEYFIYNTKHKLFGCIFYFFKRLIRKILRWYINPIIDKQNKYNTIVISALKTMNKNIEELKNELIELRYNKIKE